MDTGNRSWQKKRRKILTFNNIMITIINNILSHTFQKGGEQWQDVVARQV